MFFNSLSWDFFMKPLSESASGVHSPVSVAFASSKGGKNRRM